jgi:hypothetical protein
VHRRDDLLHQLDVEREDHLSVPRGVQRQRRRDGGSDVRSDRGRRRLRRRRGGLLVHEHRHVETAERFATCGGVTR